MYEARQSAIGGKLVHIFIFVLLLSSVRVWQFYSGIVIIIDTANETLIMRVQTELLLRVLF